MTLLPINKIERVAEKRVDVRQVDDYENSISGDAIHGGRITDFNSTGIKDQAEYVQIIVNNDKIEIKKSCLRSKPITSKICDVCSTTVLHPLP